MHEQTLKTVFGCLVHDIGKLSYRAGADSGTHSAQGYRILKQLWQDDSEILDCARFHHAAELRGSHTEKDSIAWIACVADNLSAAADRREIEGGSGSFRRLLPLSPVFTHMNGEHTGFSLGGDAQDGTLRMPKKTSAELSEGQYAALLFGLRTELPGIPRKEDWINSLLCVLESYTSNVPSSTNIGESPDISLFDHLKTTAAFGSCISEYLLTEGEKNYQSRLFANEKAFREEKAFLLYSADISGIQKFLYTVHTEGALRSLRSRSFFLELLMEHYIDELLELCGLSRVNLLYSGGGHCYILLPNTKTVIDAVERWNRKMNGFLADAFGSTLFLAHGYAPCSGNDLTNVPAEKSPYAAVFRAVSTAVSYHKLHRYDAAQIRKMNSVRKGGGERECKVCGSADDLQDGLCPWCRMFLSLSEQLQNNDIFIVSNKAETDAAFELPAPDGNAYILLTNEKTARAHLESGKAARRLYSKNKPYAGLRYATRLYFCDYAYSNSISALADNASGIRRIGVCRMDVDNLGASFVSGFRKNEGRTPADREHFVTLSRTAAFSRQLSLFFKHYVTALLSGEYGNGKALAVSVVYSGGDDVFLLGAWNDCIEAAVRIRSALREFSCGSLTISGGIALVGDTYPVRLSAELAGELEDCAKKNPGKDSIAIFDPELNQCYHWEDFSAHVQGEKLKLLRDFFQSDEQQERGKAYLYRTLQLLRSVESEGKLQLARYAYLLTRMQPKKGDPGERLYSDFSNLMYRWALDSEDRRRLITAIYLFIYEIRGEEKS